MTTPSLQLIASMSSPQTPRHSRNASAADFNPYSATSSPQERRHSKSWSFNDPSTPLRGSFNNQDGLDIAVFSSGGMGGGGGMGGLGNLADELADALSDGDEDEYYDNDGTAPNSRLDLEEGDNGQAIQEARDSGVDVESPAGHPARREKNLNLSPPTPNGRGHRRAASEYDGSEYGSETDLESPGMPPSLVTKIDAVESLARRGTESTGGAADGAFERVTNGLRELGSQSGIEACASR